MEDLYGVAARQLIHVHHVKLLSRLGAGYKVDAVADLRPVCPNCHAVIHARFPEPYLIEEVRAMFTLKLPSTGRPQKQTNSC